MIKRSVILISISAIAKAFCDSIQFHASKFPFQSDWWLGKGEYAWNNRSLLEKYIFSFVSDGWHLFDAVRIVSLLLIVALLLTEYLFERDGNDNNKGWMITLFALFGYIIHGSVFEIFYNLL